MHSGEPVCDCTPVHDTYFEAGSGRSPGRAVVEAVATAEGTDPTELDPLYEAVDGEALNRLFDHCGGSADGSMVVSFSYHGWNLFVRSDGTVRVCDPEPTVESAPVFQRPLAE